MSYRGWSAFLDKLADEAIERHERRMHGMHGDGERRAYEHAQAILRLIERERDREPATIEVRFDDGSREEIPLRQARD